jgi:hypothetical protein
MVTNNRNNTWIVASGVYTWVRLKASTELYEEYALQITRRRGSVQSFSNQDDSDQLARTVPEVHLAC